MYKHYERSIIFLLLTAISAGAQTKLTPVYHDNIYQFTGVAISAKNRLFVTYPLWSNIYKYAVVEVMKNGSAKPYPNLEMNSWSNGKDGMNKWVCVQTAYIDEDDYLYIVDAAAPMLGKIYNNSAKVVKFDLNTNQMVRTYRFRELLITVLT